MSDLCPVAVTQESPALEDQPKTSGESQLLLLKQKKYCDVTFTFPNLPDKIEAHELWLKARSPVFEQIFRLRKSGSVQCNKEIEISGCTPDRFNQFLEFVYADKFQVDIAGALDLLQLAHKYKIQPLTDKCEELLKTEIELEQSVQVFEAARRYDRKELMDRAGEIMVKAFRNRDMTSQDLRMLINAEEETVIYFLERNDLSVKEIGLFEFVLDWGKHNVGASAGEQLLKDKLKNVVSKIRYTNMTPLEFTTVVVPSGLLSAEETVSVYSYLCGNEATRGKLKMKFNTTHRKVETMENLVNFYTCQSGKSIWQAAISKQCVSFKVERLEPATEGLTDNLLEKAVITGIRFKLPRINKAYTGGIILNYTISIREHSGPTNVNNYTLRFLKALMNPKGGVADITVEPPVDLILGKTFSIIVEDLSTSNSSTLFCDYSDPYFGTFLGAPKLEASCVLEDTRLVLNEIKRLTEYYKRNYGTPDEIAMITQITTKLM